MRTVLSTSSSFARAQEWTFSCSSLAHPPVWIIDLAVVFSVLQPPAPLRGGCNHATPNARPLTSEPAGASQSGFLQPLAAYLAYSGQVPDWAASSWPCRCNESGAPLAMASGVAWKRGGVGTSTTPQRLGKSLTRLASNQGRQAPGYEERRSLFVQPRACRQEARPLLLSKRQQIADQR